MQIIDSSSFSLADRYIRMLFKGIKGIKREGRARSSKEVEGKGREMGG